MTSAKFSAKKTGITPIARARARCAQLFLHVSALLALKQESEKFPIPILKRCCGECEKRETCSRERERKLGGRGQVALQLGVQEDPALCSIPPVDIDLKLRLSIRTLY